MPEKKPQGISLRESTKDDLDFLYNVSTEAMRFVREKSSPEKIRDKAEERAEYEKTFSGKKVEIVQFNGQDVGRLRVMRSLESIYIGGIQILPEFQSKGIGTEIFKDLIEESERTKLPIVLEVHNVNEVAKKFYLNLGFIEGEKVGDQMVLRYFPKSE